MCQPVVGFEARRNRHTPCQPTRYPGPCLSSLLSYHPTPASEQRDGTCPSWWKLTRLNFGEYAFFVAPFGSTLAQVFQRTQRREGLWLSFRLTTYFGRVTAGENPRGGVLLNFVVTTRRATDMTEPT